MGCGLFGVEDLKRLFGDLRLLPAVRSFLIIGIRPTDCIVLSLLCGSFQLLSSLLAALLVELGVLGILILKDALSVLS